MGTNLKYSPSKLNDHWDQSIKLYFIKWDYYFIFLLLFEQQKKNSPHLIKCHILITILLLELLACDKNKLLPNPPEKK